MKASIRELIDEMITYVTTHLPTKHLIKMHEEGKFNNLLSLNLYLLT